MINKNAELTTKEIIEIILATAGIILIIILLYNLISPVFDKGDKTSEAYFENLEEQIKITDSGEIGEFFIWDVSDDEGRNYYLVYFGETTSFIRDDLEFSAGGNNKNTVCICSSLNEKSVCNYCKNLNYPAKSIGRGDKFVIGKGEKIFIVKGDEFYEFKSINKE